jgi:predicted acylesterase/phospholipase RssA
MKEVGIASIVIVLLAALIIAFHYQKEYKTHEAPMPIKRNGVAVIMTGAAARIPQEAALLEELYKKGLLKNVVFISGVSSGALNAVVLNGILAKKITWWDYKNILYNIKNKDVFKFDDVHFPFNTSPARELYSKILEKKMGFHTIGDLPITTGISIATIKPLQLKNVAYRMCSRKINEETDTTLNLVDILMASTAFPFVFPSARIANATTLPNVEYIDGGVGDDQVPFEALFQFEKKRGIGVEKVYIISRKEDSRTAISEELKALGIDDDGVFDDFDIPYDPSLKNGIVKRLEDYAEEAPELVPLTYVWIPDFKEDFLMFNFESMKEQYEITTRWAKKNKPKTLTEYLTPYRADKK